MYLFRLNRRTPDSKETFAEYEPHVKEFLDKCRALEHYRDTALKDYLAL